MSANSVTLADTVTNLTTTVGGRTLDAELIPTETGSNVNLTVTGQSTAIVITLEPLEAVELATTLLMYARAAAWDGEVL